MAYRVYGGWGLISPHPSSGLWAAKPGNLVPKDWRHRNITSRSIVFNDNGDSYDGFTTVYAERGN